jgi:hypothetical protein
MQLGEVVEPMLEDEEAEEEYEAQQHQLKLYQLTPHYIE